MYDSGMTPDLNTFLGGRAGVHLRETQVVTHEFGHAVSARSGLKIEKAFNAFVAREGIQPFTRYAGSKPGTEFFPEAFFIYQTDPEWLQNNHPSVYRWLHALSETGRPPAR
jgi:hypothetical protein